MAHRIDCGRSDVFYDVSRRLADQLQPVERSFTRGCHTAGYWRRILPEQLAFAGRALAGADR